MRQIVIKISFVENCFKKRDFKKREYSQNYSQTDSLSWYIYFDSVNTKQLICIENLTDTFLMFPKSFLLE